jgi:adenine/guanine phosphoribosyltransferase-like PRPP-binding protein
MHILKSKTPLKSKTKMIGVFLEPELYQFIHLMCFEQDKSKNYLINEIVSSYKASKEKKVAKAS